MLENIDDFLLKQNLKDKLIELNQIETSLWKLIDENTKLTIPILVKLMHSRVKNENKNLKEILNKNNKKQTSNVIKDILFNLELLEYILQNQLKNLKNISNLNYNQITQILDGLFNKEEIKETKYSKSSNLINRIIKDLELIKGIENE